MADSAEHINRQLRPLSDPSNKGGWTIESALSDEFNGNSLDLTKWTPGIRGWLGRPPGLIKPENVTEGDGYLNLTMRHQSVSESYASQGYGNYTTSAVESVKPILYGYFEVRAKAMLSAGSSAFWLSAKTPVNWNEIDVVEMGGKAPADPLQVFCTLHTFQVEGRSQVAATGRVTKVQASVAAQFHVYGMQWNRAGIDMFIDGVQVQHFDNTSWNDPLYLIMDAETVPNWWGLPPYTDLPSSFQVDYVRVWHQ